MEQLKTRNKVFNSILEPVVTYVHNSNFNVRPDSFTALEATLKDICKLVKNNKDISPCVNGFFNIFDSIKLSENPGVVQWQNFIKSLHNLLLRIDDYKVQCVENALNQCQAQLEPLENKLSREYIKIWFQGFCKAVRQCFSLLQQRAAEILSSSASNNIFLYMVQIASCLSLFFQLLTQEMADNILIFESRRFITKRFIYCFDGIRKILTSDDYAESSPGFIQWMDSALDCLSSIEPGGEILKNLATGKSSVEEVLCHAMSLAQICSEEDGKKIKAGTHTVLREFCQLEEECNKADVNFSLCNLYVDIVSDKLCLLEQRVNTAVLNISLRVFSNPLQPLEKLKNVCEESNDSILSRSLSDLDDLITAFDAHVDCMIQVGLFAIACSTNTKIIAGIRSSLASLESLESELIPALTSLYMEPSKVACLHARILAKHWSEEVQKLRHDVCFIIDPVAFGQVVHEDYKLYLEGLQQRLTDKEYVLDKSEINGLPEKIQVLLLVVKASLSDMKPLKDSPAVKNSKDFENVYKEVCSALDLLPHNANRAFTERVFKRIRILSTMISRTIQTFVQEDKNSSKSVLHETNNCIKKENNKPEVVNEALESSMANFQNRALQILKERSVLYKTPQKNKSILKTTCKFSEGRKMSVSFARNFTDSSLSVNEKTMDLQITEMLEELTSLANTLT